MGCKACGQQRARTRAALRNKNYKQAAKEVVRGAGMMAGVVPKTSVNSTTLGKPGKASSKTPQSGFKRPWVNR